MRSIQFNNVKSKFWLVLALFVTAALLLAACAQQATPEATEAPASPTPEPTTPPPTPTPTEEAPAPSVSVMDQAVEAGTVTVPEAVSDGPGWMVIHADADGAPGPVIGQAALSDGVNTDVSVEIDTGAATETLWAMLHTDTGEEGTYEFPDADPPVSVDDQIVVEPFTVTGLAVTPSVAVNDQDVEDGTVVVQEVVSDGPGWIVIHQEEEGAPGPVIGQAAVSDGTNENVSVEIDAAEATETLFAMLHTDTGEEGTYEFPDADPPVSVDDQIVLQPFTLGGGLPPSVVVRDQAIEAGTVTIKQVFAADPGWLVVHADQDDAPGPVVGQAAVEAGFNQDVEVEIDTAAATDQLWAMLHLDEDEMDVYEFPGGDPPVSVDDEIVVDPFMITGDEAAMAGQVTVQMVDSAFEPVDITIPVGTTVVWENSGSLPHTATADDGSFDSGTVNAGGTFAMTFTEAGEIPYYCRFHGGPGGQGMAGTITVTSP